LPIYKHGKKDHIIPFEQVKQKVIDANLSISEESFFWILYYCGVRKSEAYERVASDFKITVTRIIIDFHERKKHGAKVPPLRLHLSWHGMNKLEYIVQEAKKRKPIKKAIYTYVDKKRVREIRQDRWVFPKIQSTKAWQIVKGVLGKEYYPHFLRLNRLTEIGRDPTASLTRLKSFSGIKSTTALDVYLGTSEKEQEKAIEFMDRQYS
ncbi:hypothetical protein GTO27_10825, partial [Candidatus Bathyarchaeota archaeon]|nr:hypothetical protein [Candidatus Bathyarchaeota archaeon]